ncbi:MAG: hypothetical protein AAFP19_14615 [Bacteroidota bacterium]
MTIQDLRLSINQMLDQIEDDTILEAYLEILKNLIKIQGAQIVGYQTDGSAITRAQLNQDVLKAKKDVESGLFISHEDLKREMKNW